MPFVVAAVAVVWAVLLGVAYLARVTGELSEMRSAVAVVGSYLGLSMLALAWFGFNQTGLLSVFGMLLPCAAALGIVVSTPTKS